MRPRKNELEKLSMADMVAVISFCDDECKRYSADFSANRITDYKSAAEVRDRIYSVSVYLREQLKKKLSESYEKLLQKG